MELAGIVRLLLVERQVPPVDVCQPLDQALREPVWNGLLFLGMGYNISGNPIKLWVRILRQVLTIMLICHDCTSCLIWVECLLCALGGKRKLRF